MYGDNAMHDSGDSKWMPSNRRRFLKQVGAVGIGATFAGCSGGGGGGEFPQEDIRYIIPYGPGGSFNLYGQALAEFMPNHLPNDVDVVAENVEGAGGRRGANEVYRSDPDGYTIGTWNVPGWIVTSLIEDTEFDLSKVSWIGRYRQGIYGLVTAPDSEYSSIEDMQQSDSEVRFVTFGRSATGTLVMVIATQAMEINARYIFGSNSSSEGFRDVISGDADAMITSLTAIQEWVEDDRLELNLVFDDEAPDWASDTPTAADLGYESLNQAATIQHLVGGPPEIPDERVSVLEQALLDTLDSDEMQSWAEENQVPITPGDSQEAADTVSAMRDTFGEYEDVFREEVFNE